MRHRAASDGERTRRKSSSRKTANGRKKTAARELYRTEIGSRREPRRAPFARSPPAKQTDSKLNGDEQRRRSRIRNLVPNHFSYRASSGPSGKTDHRFRKRKRTLEHIFSRRFVSARLRCERKPRDRRTGDRPAADRPPSIVARRLLLML